ncbi:uncharacterized protein LOC143863526 isoform X2 [Tasmannia lanceolata]|uniref:uncharacterized protein LOC143863526 isoform X2 n=1 Tax=Tasmannia lanceolata TaxID=3420 RepID=UPI0040648B74
MTTKEGSDSPGWTTSYFVQTTEDVVARAVAAATSTVRSPRPSVVFSSKDDSSNSQLQKLQRQVTKVLKGFSSPPQVKRRSYNPEVLTSQKRQWANFQLQSLDQRSVKEPSRIFESMVVVGLHPNSDIQALQKRILEKNLEGPKKLRTTLSFRRQSHKEPNLEPQVLFVYPPHKQLPLKYKDLLSFCFPGGLEVHAVERTPSMSEFNEILLGQDHLKQSDLSFVFRLQVADDSTLYGCCMLVEEIVQKPSGLISMISEEEPSCSSLSRLIITTPRCYCILSRLPFFDLHFGILKSIFTEERLERLTKGIDILNLVSSEGYNNEDTLENSDNMSLKHNHAEDITVVSMERPEIHSEVSSPTSIIVNGNDPEHQMLASEMDLSREAINDHIIIQVNSETEALTAKRDSGVATHVSNGHDVSVDEVTRSKQTIESHLPEAVLPLLRHHQYESSESSSSFQGSPSEDRTSRSDMYEAEMNYASSSGQEHFSDHSDILEWAKANNHGSLQIIGEYYRLRYPARGSMLTFHPLEHLHPLEFHRPGETVLHIAGSTIDLRSCTTSLEVSEAHNALLTEEEATALSVWTVACICGCLRLENVLTMFAGALLEKQIVVVCSNLVGVKNKSAEVQSKLASVILVDANKNQVRSPTIPQLPQHKELFSSLSPYHAKLVGESYLARKRPVYECTDVQVEAAKGFLTVLRSYLDSLCSNLRSHTITNVQSNDDKVSLLLKESFIDSFASRDRPFMKLFVDTQLFSVHTDLVLSFYQKD